MKKIGKGDNRRPSFVSRDEFEDNWSKAFRRQEKNEPKMKRKKRKDINEV